MRIALVAPLYETVPPTCYGGTERVVAALADELVRRGHRVTLFASAGSDTLATLEEMAPSPLRTSMTREELEQTAPHLHLHMLAQLYDRAGEFDLIHAHTDLLTLPFVSTTSTPTVVTLHGRLDLDVVQQILPRYPHVRFISISEAQREPLAEHDIRWIATCYNGLDLDAYLAEPRGSGDYLGFVGRITAEKRPDLAVRIAAETGMPIRIAAKIDPLDQDYWTTVFKPLLSRQDVDFIGEITEADKPEFYAGARATLFPSDWPEPFGLVMVESLAAGTPVIALRRGSVPEVITHGRSGFVCDDVEDMIQATRRVDEIDPDVCRREASRFSAAAMADQYEQAYAKVVTPRAPLLPVHQPHGKTIIIPSVLDRAG